jgi:amino acid permease
MFSCFGADLVAMTVGEAKNPWRDVPITMSFVYVVPLSIYPFAMLAAGANVNYADPELPKRRLRNEVSFRDRGRRIFTTCATESFERTLHPIGIYYSQHRPLRRIS